MSALPKVRPAHSGSVGASRLGSAAAAALTACALALGAARPAAALTDEEIYRTLRFNVSTPGTRALGFGGAFIGLADDASATFTNPAGLAWLSHSEFMLDVRGTNWDDQRSTAVGVYPDLGGVDTIAPGTIVLQEQGIVAPAFVGYVQPINDYLVIAVSRHEWLNIDRNTFSTFTSTFPGVTVEPPLTAGVTRDAASTTGSLDMLLDVYSVSFASSPIEALALGVTLSAARLDVNSSITNYSYALFDASGNGVPDSFARTVDYRTVTDDDDIQFAGSFGLTWRPIDTFSVGVTYRYAPKFDLEERVQQDGVRAGDLRQYLAVQGVGDASGRFINRFAIPDSYGVGLAFGPYGGHRRGSGLVVMADAVEVQYSDMLEGFVAGLNNQLFGNASKGVGFTLDDRTEYHLGIGYTWMVGYDNSIHLRGGAYTDPDHSILAAGRGAGVGAFSGREDDLVHATLGLGFTLRRGFYSVEFDAAADVSDLGGQYSGTTRIRF